MGPDTHHDPDHLAERTTRLLSHLDGVLEEATLASMRDAWTLLEMAATDSHAHARSVRSRLFWETLAPGAVRTAPAGIVTDLVASWDDEPLDAGLDAA